MKGKCVYQNVQCETAKNRDLLKNKKQLDC